MYKSADFDNLFWNPYNNPSGVRKLWNTLNLYKEFQEKISGIKEDVFFNYMELVYHKDCVMLKDFENINDRKSKALELLGIKKTKNNYPDGVQEILDGNNFIANKMIIRFCTLQKSQEFSLLTISNTTFDRLMFRMLEEAENVDMEKAVKNTRALQKQLGEILTDINAYKKSIFMGDSKVENDIDEELLAHARVEGFTEMVVRGKIKINMEQ